MRFVDKIYFIFENHPNSHGPPLDSDCCRRSAPGGEESGVLNSTRRDDKRLSF
jgi:hypothetical protein